MRKIKLWVETGIVGGEHEDIIEVEDDTTEEELNEMALEFMWGYVQYGWSEAEEEDE